MLSACCVLGLGEVGDSTSMFKTFAIPSLRKLFYTPV
jgi:hypothetical protein